MSAWLCGKGTLSLVVDVIHSDEFKEYNEEYHCKSNEELIETLTALNTKSLNCRYGESDEHILDDKEYVSLDVSDLQRYVSVHCYLYQSCECEENYDHPLFASLNKWGDEHDELEQERGNGGYHWDIDVIL